MVTNATNIKLNTLLTKLLAKQQEEALTDQQFAEKLGIVRPHWSLTRRGKRPIGLLLLQGVVPTYPDLIPDVIEFLRGNHETAPSSAQAPENQPEERKIFSL